MTMTCCLALFTFQPTSKFKGKHYYCVDNKDCNHAKRKPLKTQGAKNQGTVN